MIETDPPQRRGSSTAKDKAEGATAFAVAARVTWSSQAGGIVKHKTGEIIAVIPAGKSPKKVDKERFKKFASERQHESYIVDVDGELYWPVVSQLRDAKGK